ncbi:hypothetical protein [Streptomyces guryensis]|uniref:Uncharacterized protein n=1 Tax=Streptomyces guryensis TaxID=2886947 RepID=A0A9Q3VM95_9ACTN|nr:hypothetical protein [Streptomyces guryensis]MCD9873460.1 hypothetical protein [Streptomyces guryensis]
MSGGERYWNEDTQRWEDGTGGSPAAEPTLPTPVEEGPPPSGPDYPAPPASTPTVGTAAPTVESEAPAVGTQPPTVGAQGWPGGGADSAWHGPGAEGPVPEWSTGASWPPPAPAPAPAPAGGLNRRLVWSVVVGSAVVGVAVSLVLTLVVGKDDGSGKKPVAASSVTPSTPSTDSASPDVSPSPYADDTGSLSPSASAPPAGYELRDDTEGFRIAIPQGWSRSSTDSVYGMAVVNYRSADREQRLQVYQVQESSPDASFKLYLSDQTPKPAGFKKLDLQKLDDGRFTGSRLEYQAGTIKGEPDVGTWHVYDERFVAADGNIYAIASYGPDSTGHDAQLADLTTALKWFCPPYTTCGPDPGTD